MKYKRAAQYFWIAVLVFDIVIVTKSIIDHDWLKAAIFAVFGLCTWQWVAQIRSSIK